MTLDLGSSIFPRVGPRQLRRDRSASWSTTGSGTSATAPRWSATAGSTRSTNGPTRRSTSASILNRPDRTSFYLGYRQIDPLESQAVVGSVTYAFSPKYAMTASTVYDFGIGQTRRTSLMFTRIGTDLRVSLGVVVQLDDRTTSA